MTAPVSTAPKQSRFRKLTGWSAIAFGLLLLIALVAIPTPPGREKLSFLSALLLPSLLVGAGFYLLGRRKYAGVCLIAASIVWGWGTIASLHTAGESISGMLGASMIPIGVLLAGLYLLGLIKKLS